MRYIYIKLSFRDKIKVLLFNLFPENSVITTNPVQYNSYQNIPTPTPSEKNKGNINSRESKDFKVPFFTDTEEKVKTNF